MSTTNNNNTPCPRCSCKMPDHVGALSRIDNVTYICSECGIIEAILQWNGLLTDWREDK